MIFGGIKKQKKTKQLRLLFLVPIKIAWLYVTFSSLEHIYHVCDVVSKFI